MKIKNIKIKPLFYILLFLLIAIQSYFYIEHIVSNYKLANGYKYFNEITLLDNKKVSNTEYINKNLLFHPYKIGTYKYSANNIFFEGKKHKGFDFMHYSKYIVLNDFELNSYKSLLSNYNIHFRQILFSRKKDQTWMEYSNKLLMKNNVIEHSNKLLMKNNIIEHDFKYYPLFIAKNKDKLEQTMKFIKANIYEQNMQIFDRYYIEENSFILCPINSMELGKPLNQIFSQYGYLSVKIISSIMKLYGGININNYEKAKGTINLIYFALAISFIFLFFKDNLLRLIFLLLFGIALFGNGYYHFSYAPDNSAFRHLLDLLIILFLYFYNKSSNKTYLILISILGVVSIWIAKGFGLFIFLALIAFFIINLVLKYFENKTINIFELIISLITLIIGLISLKVYPLMPNPSIKYFIDGFYNFPFDRPYIFIGVLSIIIFQWFSLLFFYRKLNKFKYLYVYLFLLFYTEFLFSYYVWHGTSNNIIFFIYIFALPLMIIYNINNFKWRKQINILALMIFGIIYIFCLNKFIQGEKRYEYIFKTHKLYKWNYPRAGGIITTYSFKPFENSIKLIQKYNPKKEFFMISKYDNILAFLSKKYSGFPFFELRSSIVTKQNFKMIKHLILKKANILFVDNDINRNFNKELKKHDFFDIYNQLFEKENLKQRIPKLENLKKLWNEVKKKYKLVEKGKLISVYRRKND